jgi:hypothetical protein
MPDLLPALSLATDADPLVLYGAGRCLCWVRRRERRGWDVRLAGPYPSLAQAESDSHCESHAGARPSIEVCS